MTAAEIVTLEGVYFEYPSSRSHNDTLKDHVIQRIRGKKESAAVSSPQLLNVSLRIFAGESVGIVGRNGSGKSTLLKVLCGIARPNIGSCVVRGAVTPLLDLGIGMHPELTVTENISLSLAYLGIPRRKQSDLCDSILEWGELHELLNETTGHLSTGVRSRLAFAVSTSVFREVVVIDEVLSVGDLSFETKVSQRLANARDAGSVVVTVSHNLGYLTSAVNRVLWMERGEIVMDGKPKEVINQYRASFNL